MINAIHPAINGIICIVAAPVGRDRRLLAGPAEQSADGFGNGVALLGRRRGAFQKLLHLVQLAISEFHLGLAQAAIVEADRNPLDRAGGKRAVQ